MFNLPNGVYRIIRVDLQGDQSKVHSKSYPSEEAAKPDLQFLEKQAEKVAAGRFRFQAILDFS